MTTIINAIAKLLPDLVFPPLSKDAQRILDTPIKAMSAEEALRHDFTQIGNEIRAAAQKAMIKVHE